MQKGTLSEIVASMAKKARKTADFQARKRFICKKLTLPNLDDDRYRVEIGLPSLLEAESRQDNVFNRPFNEWARLGEMQPKYDAHLIRVSNALGYNEGEIDPDFLKTLGIEAEAQTSYAFSLARKTELKAGIDFKPAKMLE